MSNFQGKGPDLNPFVGLKDFDIGVGELVSVLLILREHGIKLRDMPDLSEKKIAGVDFSSNENVEIPFSGLINTPTTLAEYGITDSIKLSDLVGLLANKVDVVAGKGLSSNDYTTADKNKLSSITNISGINTGDQTTITGNAGTATKLQTARTISISGDATGIMTFDGSANKDIALTIIDDSHNHIISNVDGLADALSLKADKTQILTNVPANAIFTDTVYSDTDLTNKITTEKNRVDALIISKVDTVAGKGLSSNDYTAAEKTKLSSIATGATISGTNTGDETIATIKSKLGITTLSGANTGDQTTITGNAGTATKLQTARSISISGGGAGSASFDGSSNVSIALAIANPTSTIVGGIKIRMNGTTAYITTDGTTA